MKHCGNRIPIEHNVGLICGFDKDIVGGGTFQCATCKLREAEDMRLTEFSNNLGEAATTHEPVMAGIWGPTGEAIFYISDTALKKLKREQL